MIIEVNPNKKNKICSPVIGFEAENKVTGFEFDYSDWAADIGDGYLTLSVKRPTDTIPYPVSLTQTGTHKATWTVSSTDVAFAGRGEVQLTYIVDDKVKKSAIYEILIDRSLEPDGDIPDPYISWFEELLQVSVQVEADADRAEAAADSIKNLEAVAVTLPSGESATAEYDPETGVMSFGIPKGDTGDVGPTGNGISSTVLNADYTLTINFTDGTSYTTPSIRGEQGIQGETGNGIASTVLNPDYTLTITFTNGTTYTTPSIRGPEGAEGQTGPTGNGIDNVTMDASGYLTITFTDGSTWTSPTSLFGPVQDVKVNGDSVVDENGVANITIPIITKTVSGNPIVLDDADGAVQALNVELLPVQEGTPTQDSTVYNEPYLSKTSPNFNSEYDKLVGGTVAWNQLVSTNGATSETKNGITFTNNGDGSWTINGTATADVSKLVQSLARAYVQGHKMLYLCDNFGYREWGFIPNGSSSPDAYLKASQIIGVASNPVIAVLNGVTVNNITIHPMVIDLTQMFGTAIANAAYTKEQNQAGSGIAWLKSYGFFTEDYYEYNVGELISTKPTAHVTSETYPLAGVELRGIPKLNTDKMYYDGDTYESDGTVTRKYGIVDLGTLNWSYHSSFLLFYTGINDAVNSANTGLHGVCSKYRCVVGYNPTGGINDTTQDKVFSIGSSFITVENNLLIRDTAYTDATAFKQAMSGVYIVYELATPTTEEADPYQNPQAVGSTESYTDTRAVPIPVGHESTYANIYPITGYDNTIITDSNGTDTTTKTVTLPHTVYGADVDVTGGESKETIVKVVLDGTQVIRQANWRPTATSVGWIYPYSIFQNKTVPYNEVPSGLISDCLPAQNYNDLWKGDVVGVGVYNVNTYGLFVRVNDTSLTTEQAINAYLSENPITVCYPLATPTDLQTTPTDVELYKGDNVVSADGTMTLTYVRNLQMVIDKIESAL